MTSGNITRQALEAISLDSTATISERLQAITMLQQIDSDKSSVANSTAVISESETDSSVSEPNDPLAIVIAGDDPVSDMPSKARDRASMRMGRLRLP